MTKTKQRTCSRCNGDGWTEHSPGYVRICDSCEEEKLRGYTADEWVEMIAQGAVAEVSDEVNEFVNKHAYSDLRKQSRRTIWKFPLKAKNSQVIKIPKGYKILTVSDQNDKPTIWALVNPEEVEDTLNSTYDNNPISCFKWKDYYIIMTPTEILQRDLDLIKNIKSLKFLRFCQSVDEYQLFIKNLIEKENRRKRFELALGKKMFYKSKMTINISK